MYIQNKTKCFLCNLIMIPNKSVIHNVYSLKYNAYIDICENCFENNNIIDLDNLCDITTQVFDDNKTKSLLL